MQATIGGVFFDEAPRDLDRSFVIEPQGLKGWLAGVSMRRDEVARPASHGAFDARGFQSARVVSISGTILAQSPSELESMIVQLTGLLADGETGRLTVQDDHARVTWADVRLAAQTEIDRYTTGLEADYLVQFWAPDPRRYGELRSFPAGQVYHRGNTVAIPVIEVTGPVSAPYSVSSQGRTVTVTQALASGQVHQIDMATGWVRRNGVLQLGAVSAADVFTIPPGTGVAVSGPSSMRVLVHDTFI